MNLVLFSLVLLALCVLFVGFPLFFQKLSPLQFSEKKEEEFSEPESLLMSLSELDDEYMLGKHSKKDYQSHRLKLQRRYLELQKTSTKNESL